MKNKEKRSWEKEEYFLDFLWKILLLGAKKCPWKIKTRWRNFFTELLVCFSNLYRVFRSFYFSSFLIERALNVNICFLSQCLFIDFIYTAAKYTPDQQKKMEESIRIRKASEPIKLIEVVKFILGLGFVVIV